MKNFHQKQLIDHPKPEVMFNKNYPFFTSSSKYMISHFRDYSQWINQNYGSNLKKIIEIGSNDGTFLKNFKNTSRLTLWGVFLCCCKMR